MATGIQSKTRPGVNVTGNLRKRILPQAIALFYGVVLPGTYVLAEEGSALRLEEVIVTAEKRQQSLQDVPISITAMDEDALEKFGIDELEDIGGQVPNVTVNEFFGIATTFRAFIRGVGAITVEVTQDPAVALYVDGIYVGSSYGGSFESSDLERIEVLRGPQGTLYGRNATGGAINLISKKPELGDWSFNQTLTGGNHGRFKTNTAVNIPLGEKAAARLVYMQSERDGWVENTGAGEDFSVEDRSSARLALHFAPTDNVTVDFSLDHATIEDTVRYTQVLSGYAAPVAGTNTPINVPLGPPGSPTVDVVFPDPITRDRLKKGYSVFPVEPDDNTILGSSLTLSWDISENTTLKSITGYRDVDARQFSQVSGTPYASLNVPGVPFPLGPFTVGPGGIFEMQFSQFTQEFQLIGGLELSGAPLQYIAGVYYYSDEGDNDDLTMMFSGINAPETNYTKTENESVAIYGQATLSLSDWDITLGARYSQDQREAVRTNLSAANPFFDTPYDKDFNNFSPSLTLAYHLNEDVNVYAKMVTGYRSGGTSTLSYEGPLFQRGADEETIVSYELGIKGDFLEQRLRVNGAVFYMDYQDYQASIQTGPTSVQRDVFNVGDVSIAGAEMDITALLSERLTLSLGAGYLETEVKEDSVDPGTGAPPTALISEVAFAPHFSGTTSLDYFQPLTNGLVLQGNINYSYQSEAETGLVPGSTQLNNSYGLWGASISLSDIPFAGGMVKMMLWGRNLTDEEYYTNNIGPYAFFGAAEVTPFGDPRTYGFTVNYQFD